MTGTRAERIVASATAIAGQGNPVHAIRLLAAELDDGAVLVDVAPRISEIVTACPRPLFTTELDTIRALLAKVTSDPSLSRVLTDAVYEAAISVRRFEVPLAAACVLALTRAQAGHLVFGIVQPLHVSGLVGRKHAFAVLNSSGETREAFDRGICCALDYLHRHGAGSLDSAVVLNWYGFSAELPALAANTPLSGRSMGLAVGLGVLSALLQKGPRPDVAVTGLLDASGGVHGIRYFDEKVAAARDAGLSVLCPMDNVPAADPPTFLKGVSTFDQAVGFMFEDKDIEAGLETLRTQKLAPRERELRYMPVDEDTPLTGGILISAVGEHDPGGAGAAEDGPVLAIAHAYRPTRALLLHTPERDFVDRARKTQMALARLECLATPMTVDTPDPTEFSSLFRDFRRIVVAYVMAQQVLATVPVLTNVSSGTPQMQLTLHMLVERGLLPDLRMQTASTDVRAGWRVRRVILPLL